MLSIHQPRYDIFALLDDILLLSRGKQMWWGSAHDMIAHFSALGHPCPPLTNPADFILDITSIDVSHLLIFDKTIDTRCFSFEISSARLSHERDGAICTMPSIRRRLPQMSKSRRIFWANDKKLKTEMEPDFRQQYTRHNRSFRFCIHYPYSSNAHSQTSCDNLWSCPQECLKACSLL